MCSVGKREAKNFVDSAKAVRGNRTLGDSEGKSKRMKMENIVHTRENGDSKGGDVCTRP